MMEWTDLPDDYGKTPDGKYYEKKLRNYEKQLLDWDKLFNSVAREMARQADAQREELNKRVIENFQAHVANADARMRNVALDDLFADVFGHRSFECLEAETLKNSGIIPPWRPYTSRS